MERSASESVMERRTLLFTARCRPQSQPTHHAGAWRSAAASGRRQRL